MPRRKTVPRLKRLVFSEIARLCNASIDRIQQGAVISISPLTRRLYGDPRHGDEKDRTQAEIEVIDEQWLESAVTDVREFLLEELPHNLALDLAALWLNVLSHALQKFWNPDNFAERGNANANNNGGEVVDLSASDHRIFVSLRLSHVVTEWPGLTGLNLSRMRRQLRGQIYSRLDRVGGGGDENWALKHLDLGQGVGGGWLRRDFLDRYYLKPVSRFRSLAVFRLRNDATDAILRTVLENCWRTLKVADVAHSTRVTDEALDWLLSREIDSNNNERRGSVDVVGKLDDNDVIETSTTSKTFAPHWPLEELSLAGTGVKPPTAARILRCTLLAGLRSFAVENFGDVLGHLCEKKSIEEVSGENFAPLRRPQHKSLQDGKTTFVSLIRDLSPASSENADHAMGNDHFSLRHPLERLPESFPHLRRLSCEFAAEHLRHVEKLEHLSHLSLRGGELLANNAFLPAFGHRLNRLDLIHADIPGNAAATLETLARFCPNLSALSLSNCFATHSTAPTSSLGTPGSSSWGSLRRLALRSNFDRELLVFLLVFCPRIAELDLGFSCDFSDAIISQALSSDDDPSGGKCASSPLKKLQALKISGSKSLTMYGILLIIRHCPDLYVLRGLRSCDLITEVEVKSLEKWIVGHNLLLDAS